MDLVYGSLLDCEVTSEAEVNCNGTLYSSETDDLIEPFSLDFWLYLAIYCTLVLFAGLASGLTLGLLSLDTTTLLVLAQGAESAVERKQAQALLPIIKRHHLLLVTLLLTNAVAVEAMPVFLDRLAGPVTAVVVSVTAVLFFGEVIPQALCSRFGTAIGYYARPLVYFLMVCTFIIAWPLSKFLDCVLGQQHGTYYKRSELGALVDILAADNHDNPEPLSSDEKSIIKGALLMRNKSVEDVKYTKLDNVDMIDYDSIYSQETVTYMLKCGRSRFPVYSKRRGNVKGMLISKRLVGCDTTDKIPVRDLLVYRGCKINRIHEKRPLYEAMNDFQEGEHLSLVTRAIEVKDAEGNVELKPSEDEAHVLGIITLEDILEELLQEPIYDEMDLLRSLRRGFGKSGAFAHSASGNYGASLGISVSSQAGRSTRMTRQPLYLRQQSNPNRPHMTPRTPLLYRRKLSESNQFQGQERSRRHSREHPNPLTANSRISMSALDRHWRPSLNSTETLEHPVTGQFIDPSENNFNFDNEAYLP